MRNNMNIMQQTRAYKFRIYPDAKRQREIDEMFILAQEFYNKLLEKSIQSYKDGNHKIFNGATQQVRK